MTRRILLLVLALGSASCEIKAAPVQFFAICAPTTNCEFEANCSLQWIGDYRLDLATLPAASQDYTLYVEIHNQAAKNDDLASGQVNTRDAFVQEIVVEYEGVPLPRTVTRLQQSVPAEGTAVIGFQAVDSAGVSTLGGIVTGAVTQAQVVAKIKGRGIFGDGSSFETLPYEVPFKVCRFCAGGCPAVGQLGCPHLGQTPYACIE